VDGGSAPDDDQLDELMCVKIDSFVVHAVPYGEREPGIREKGGGGKNGDLGDHSDEIMLVFEDLIKDSSGGSGYACPRFIQSAIHGIGRAAIAPPFFSPTHETRNQFSTVWWIRYGDGFPLDRRLRV
jgi:hypothetical protein